MQYEWYIDVFFLAEWARNALALRLAAFLGKKRPVWYRLMLSAAVGSIWSILVILFPILPIPAERVITILAVGGLMAMLAFPVNTLREIGAMTGYLFLASAVLSGGLLAFEEFFFLPAWESLAVMALLGGAVRAFLAASQKRRALTRLRYPVRLFYEGREKEFLALVDSGNRLKEPVSKKPVSVIFLGDCAGFCDRVSSVLYIPYCSVGREHGMLAGMIFEKMEIVRETDVLTVQRPIVAVAKRPLSVNGDFSMLLPEELMD